MCRQGCSINTPFPAAAVQGLGLRDQRVKARALEGKLCRPMINEAPPFKGPYYNPRAPTIIPIKGRVFFS